MSGPAWPGLHCPPRSALPRGVRSPLDKGLRGPCLSPSTMCIPDASAPRGSRRPPVPTRTLCGSSLLLPSACVIFFQGAEQSLPPPGRLPCMRLTACMNLGLISLGGPAPSHCRSPCLPACPSGSSPTLATTQVWPCHPSLPYKHSKPSCHLQRPVQTLWLTTGELAPGPPSSIPTGCIPTWNGNLAPPL